MELYSNVLRFAKIAPGVTQFYTPDDRFADLEREQRGLRDEESAQSSIWPPRPPLSVTSNRVLERAQEEVRRVEELIRQRMREADRETDYHHEMRQKYEYAAAHPWESVEPDPPPP